MGDSLNISKDKRHRSSSSLAGNTIEGTRSERKLEIRASIPEVDDHFATAEVRCDELQDKINMIKILKKKKRLKRKSMTRVLEKSENIPFITVRTQPKNKISQASHLRQFEIPTSIRGYQDPTTLEQHRMIGQVRGYGQSGVGVPTNQKNKQSIIAMQPSNKAAPRRARADGDAGDPYVRLTRKSSDEEIQGDVTWDKSGSDYTDEDFNDQRHEYGITKKNPDTRHRRAQIDNIHCTHVPKEPTRNEVVAASVPGTHDGRKLNSSPVYRRRQNNQSTGITSAPKQSEDRPVVELFKNRGSVSPDSNTQQHKPSVNNRKPKKGNITKIDNLTPTLELSEEQPPIKEQPTSRPARKIKYRSHGYEQPTIASQMKQSSARCYSNVSNQSNLPFVVSKSTAPSHNIVVNIQKVLNGVKKQQPLYGIPPTIAYHMGLGHIPSNLTNNKSLPSTLYDQEINAIKLGQQLLRLPSYKNNMSYKRLLSLFKEGEGLVPRFLRAISRPHYFYTSMYNLQINQDDFDGATSKGRSCSQDAKQSLAEYAGLYREYEQVDNQIKRGQCDPELERHREELSKKLGAREEHIRRIMHEFKASGDMDQALRASASTDEAYRHSTYKLNLGQAKL